MGEPLGLLGAAGAATSVCGVGVLTRPRFLFGSSGGLAPGEAMGVALAAASAACLSASMLLLRFLGKR